MKVARELKEKYFQFSKKNMEFAFLSSLYAFIPCLLHILIHPKHDYFISFALGIIISSIVLVQMLHEPLQRKLKYGFYISLFTSIALFFGSYFYQNLLIINGFIFILTCYVGLAVLVNLYFFNASLFISSLFIIGRGFHSNSIETCFHNGLSFFLGGLCLTLSFLILDFNYSDKKQSWKEIKNLISHPYFQIPKLNPLTKDSILFFIQLCLAMLIANTLAFYSNLSNSYWIPMTVLLVLKPDPSFSYERIKHRFIGTFLGSFVGIPLALIENKIVLSFFILPSLFFIINSATKHYGSFVFFLTAMISVFMNLIKSNGILAVEYRITDTVLGLVTAGIMVLLTTLIRKHFSKELF